MLRKGPKIHYENIKKTNSTTQNVSQDFVHRIKRWNFAIAILGSKRGKSTEKHTDGKRRRDYQKRLPALS